MSNDMHEMAKKLYEMRGAAKKKPANNVSQGAKSPINKAVKKAEPAKAAAKPSTKQPAVKKAPDTARKATMKKQVAKSKPKVQPGPMPEANLPEAGGEMEEVIEKTKKGAKRSKLLAEHADDLGDNAFMELERDLPKGAARAGERLALEEGEHLAAGAAEKGAMRLMRLKALAKPSLGSLGAASALGGITGLALQALMEGVQAEDSNPASHDRAAISAAKSTAQMRPGKVAPRSQLQDKLPSQVKTPRMRDDWDRDPNQDSDQARMENDFAHELQTWPR